MDNPRPRAAANLLYRFTLSDADGQVYVTDHLCLGVEDAGREATACAEVMGLTLQGAQRLRSATPLPAGAKWLRSHPNYRRG